MVEDAVRQVGGKAGGKADPLEALFSDESLGVLPILQERRELHQKRAEGSGEAEGEQSEQSEQSDVRPEGLEQVRRLLMKTHGVVLYTTRLRCSRDLEGFRDRCRKHFPVESKYTRFDFMDHNPEDWRSLQRIALKGDVLDVGMVGAGAFNALYVLNAMGIPNVLLGADNFLAGIIHLQPFVGIQSKESAFPLTESGDHALIERVSRALSLSRGGGSGSPPVGIDAVRLRSPSDSGVNLRLIEVYLPNAELNALVGGGRLHEAGDLWRRASKRHGGGGIHAQAISAVAQGLVDPRDVEREIGPIDAI